MQARLLSSLVGPLDETPKLVEAGGRAQRVLGVARPPVADLADIAHCLVVPRLRLARIQVQLHDETLTLRDDLKEGTLPPKVVDRALVDPSRYVRTQTATELIDLLEEIEIAAGLPDRWCSREYSVFWLIDPGLECFVVVAVEALGGATSMISSKARFDAVHGNDGLAELLLESLDQLARGLRASDVSASRTRLSVNTRSPQLSSSPSVKASRLMSRTDLATSLAAEGRETRYRLPAGAIQRLSNLMTSARRS